MRMPNNIFAMRNQLMQNPSKFLSQFGINIPDGTTDTNEIIKHIMNTGRVSQAQYNSIMSMKNMFKR